LVKYYLIIISQVSGIRHGDGTFHSAAKYFSQLYILHGWLAERMIPAAFILMKRRRAKDYNEVFEVLLKESK
jgi:hypothetical protein